MLKLLGKILLNADERRLGAALVQSGIKGAKVIGRGTIVVDGQAIASSKEFVALKRQARKIVSYCRAAETRC